MFGILVVYGQQMVVMVVAVLDFTFPSRTSCLREVPRLFFLGKLIKETAVDCSGFFCAFAVWGSRVKVFERWWVRV